MTVTNLAPPTADSKIVKTLAFPFQRGRLKFPAMARPTQPVFNSITALLLTGKNERVMRPDFGVGVHDNLFATMSPIMQARVSADAVRSIQRYEPRADVLSVIPSEKTGDNNERTAIVFDLLYKVAGQPEKNQVLVPTTMQGT